MPRLLVLVPFCDEHLDRLRSAAGAGWEFELHRPRRRDAEDSNPDKGDVLPHEQLVEALVRSDVVIGNPDPQALREAVARGSNLRLVQLCSAGTDAYTQGEQAFPAELQLCSAVGAFGQIISQYVVAQILSLMQNLAAYRDQQHSELWKDLGPVESLDGGRVLIFGAGGIGGAVARRLAGFDCQVVGVCRSVDRPRQDFDKLVTLEDAEEELEHADVVVGALPNTLATKKWLNAQRISRMKSGAILVNVGRGNFVDGNALLWALHEGALRGAALDVSDPEPLPADHGLWHEPRCVITPHVSGGSFGRHRQTEDNIFAICCENVRAMSRAMAHEYAVAHNPAGTQNPAGAHEDAAAATADIPLRNLVPTSAFAAGTKQYAQS